MQTKVVIYTRISTKGQSLYSLPKQRELLEEFCRLKNWEVVGVFEEQYSAKTFKRPEFAKAVKKAIYSGATKLLVLDWSRFSRNFTEAVAKVDELRKRGIEVNAMLQWIHYDQPEHLFLFSVFLAHPDVENRYRSLSTKRGLSLARRAGRCTFKAPIGYKNERDSSGRSFARVDMPKAVIIREIFEDFANGSSVNQIKSKYSKEGFNVSKSSLYRILRNKFYIGKIHVPDATEIEESYINGIHSAIIELDIFNKVQDRLDNEKEKKSPNDIK